MHTKPYGRQLRCWKRAFVCDYNLRQHKLYIWIVSYEGYDVKYARLVHPGTFSTVIGGLARCSRSVAMEQAYWSCIKAHTQQHLASRYEPEVIKPLHAANALARIVSTAISSRTRKLPMRPSVSDARFQKSGHPSSSASNNADVLGVISFLLCRPSKNSSPQRLANGFFDTKLYLHNSGVSVVVFV